MNQYAKYLITLLLFACVFIIPIFAHADCYSFDETQTRLNHA